MDAAAQHIPTLDGCTGYVVHPKDSDVRTDEIRSQHRGRCDLGLFRLGLRLRARGLQDAIPLPDACLVPAILLSKPVRQPLNQAI